LRGNCFGCCIHFCNFIETTGMSKRDHKFLCGNQRCTNRSDKKKLFGQQRPLPPFVDPVKLKAFNDAKAAGGIPRSENKCCNGCSQLPRDQWCEDVCIGFESELFEFKLFQCPLQSPPTRSSAYSFGLGFLFESELFEFNCFKSELFRCLLQWPPTCSSVLFVILRLSLSF